VESWNLRRHGASPRLFQPVRTSQHLLITPSQLSIELFVPLVSGWCPKYNS